MPALMATIGANADPFKRELVQTEVAAAAAAARIERGTRAGAEGQKSWNQVMREGVVLLREISRGNWSRVPGSFTIFIQRLNEQLPILKTLLNPVTLGLAAVAAAAVWVAMQFKHLADAEQELNDITGGGSKLWKYMGDAMEEASKRAEKFSDWLEHIRDNHVTLAQSTNERVKQMREEFEMQQKLADAKGQTPEQKEAAEIAETKKEEAVLSKATDQAWVNAEDAISDAKKKEKTANDPDAASKLKDLEERRKKAKEVLDKASEAYQKETGLDPSKSADDFTGGKHLHLKDDKGNTLPSLAEAQDEFAKINQQTTTYARKQQQANEAAERAHKQAEEAEKTFNELKKQFDETTAKRKLEEKYGPDIARAVENKKDKKHEEVLRGHVNSLQAVGAYTSPAQVEMVTLGKQIAHHVQVIATHLTKNKPTKPSSTGVYHGP